MAVTLWEAIAGTTQGEHSCRAGEPVHRYTKTQRGREGRFWQPFSRRNAARILRAAERYDRVQRLKHRQERNRRQNGALGHVGLEVLRELLRLIDWRTGRLDPAITTLADRLGRSVGAIVAALKRLRDHGWLSWIRRYEPTGNAEGPQVRQISNAYALMIPASAQIEDEPPLPDDELDRRQTETATYRAMIASLPLFERNRAMVGDAELADTLSRLEAAIIAREALAGA